MPLLSQKTDEEVIRLVQAGDSDSFGILIERYEEKMKRYARKFSSQKDDIDDIVQEIFIKAYRNIQGFDPKRKFSSWIYRVAHNELINHLNRKKRDFVLFDLDIFLPYVFKKDETEKDIDRESMQKMLDKCLDKLDFKYREPIVLFYLEGLGYKEISDIMEIPISTVGVRIRRAKILMKNIFKKIGYNNNG